jgi:hypothetical protein
MNFTQAAIQHFENIVERGKQADAEREKWRRDSFEIDVKRKFDAIISDSGFDFQPQYQFNWDIPYWGKNVVQIDFDDDDSILVLFDDDDRILVVGFDITATSPNGGFEPHVTLKGKMFKGLFDLGRIFLEHPQRPRTMAQLQEEINDQLAKASQ